MRLAGERAAATATTLGRTRSARGGPSALDDPLESWEPEECVARAEVHLLSARFERALAWVIKAKSLAHTSASVRATEAFLLGRLGRLEEALESYGKASRLMPEDGEPDLCAARLTAGQGWSLDLVESLLLRALAKTPRLVQEVDGDPAFAALAGRPACASAVVAAWGAFM